MTAIDLAALLTEISGDAPSGPSLEYDDRFIELEKVARGVEQEEDASGKVIREEEPPDWPEVERLALELAAETKDIRVAVYLARARLALVGFPGFREGLDLLKGYLSLFWPSLHPQLDPGDNNDPSIRVNTLASLCDNATILRPLRMAPLTESRQFGRISYRDYAIASGLMPAPPSRRADEKAIDMGQVDGAFADTPAETLSATQQAVAGAQEALTETDSLLDDVLGAGNGPDLSALGKLLAEIRTVLDREVAKRGGGEVAEAGERAEMPVEGSTVPVSAISGAVRNRDDVLLLLDKICRYYSDYEPSSPVPIILNRTKRLVTMGFLDILKDLTPGGVQEFGIIAGIKEEE